MHPRASQPTRASPGLRGLASAAPALLSLLLLSCSALPRGARSQGLVEADGMATSDSMAAAIDKWNAVSARAAAVWGPKQWQARRTASCRSPATPGNACGADVSGPDARAALLVAASPDAYDSRLPAHGGGVVAAPAPRDQHECDASAAMAVAAAADSALSRATGRNLSASLVSARALFFCGAVGPGPGHNCASGWELEGALALLTGAGPLPLERCLPFVDTDEISLMTDDVICDPACDAVVEPGVFSYTKRTPLDSIAKVQEHIRRNGAAVTRMRVTPGFQERYAPGGGGDRQAVWTSGGAGTGKQNQAVVLIGYNNTGGYWLVQSSWGKDWGDNGVVKVQYGKLRIGQPTNTYGVVFSPSSPPPSRHLSVALPPGAAAGPGCQQYTVTHPTFLSRVAYETGADLGGLVADNSKAISDLGAWIRPGEKLTVCGADPQRTGGTTANSTAPWPARGAPNAGPAATPRARRSAGRRRGTAAATSGGGGGGGGAALPPEDYGGVDDYGGGGVRPLLRAALPPGPTALDIAGIAGPESGDGGGGS